MNIEAAFTDLALFFNTVNRDGLSKILARLGCPPKVFTICNSPLKVRCGK